MENNIENAREKRLVTAIKKDKKNITKERARVIGGTLLSAVGFLGVAFFSGDLALQLKELDAITLNSLFLSNSVVAEFLLSIAVITKGTGMIIDGFDIGEMRSHSLKRHQEELDNLNSKRK